MSKIYFSRSISRTMSADHPVGDPTGGAAYGEKNDPISAIISIASMAGTYAAAGTFTAMTLMQGLTFAGAAMSLVGNVTGNKTLSKIGMVAGVAGGLGQMGAFGETAKSATWGSTFGGSSAAPVAPGTGNAPLKGTPTNTTTVAGTSKDVAAYGQTTAANAPAMTGGAPGVTPQANIPNSPTYTAPVADASGVLANTSATTAPTSLLDKTVSGTMEMGKDIYGGLKSAGSGIMSFAKENPYGAMAVGQIAAPISEYLSGKTDAEIDALEAQTRANEANAGFADERTQQLKEEIAREKMRRANLNAGYGQIDAGITINPNAYTARQGLIAQQMQQA